MLKTFADFPILPEIKKSLESLGITHPTEIQTKVIPLLLENPKTDIHAQAQTGTGKTLAFGIPLLQFIDSKQKEPQALIIAPTRELVLQIYESLKDISRQTNIIVEPIFGGMPINRQIENIRRGAQVIVGTPGRLNDHLRRKTLSLKSLKLLILDEADIMLEMGFKEEIDNILKFSPKDRAIWLFSATVMPGIKEIIKSHMKNVISVKAEAKDLVTPSVKQYYCLTPIRKRVDIAARFIEAAPEFYGIIFCQTKILTSEVTEQLSSKGFKANCLHGDMSQSLRNQVIKGFKNKDFNILVATDVAARGIDVTGLTHVINFSIPDEYETYVHRIGRTGRAGKEGIAILFISASDMYRIRRLEKITNVKLQEIPIPPISTIINVKMIAVSDFIEQAKQPDKRLSPVHLSLKEMINSFSEEEIKNSLAVALEERFFKDIVNEDLTKINTESNLLPQEICIELGNENGISDSDVREYIYKTCKLLPQEVSKVRVLRTKTFISIPENKMTSCLNSMRSTPIINKPHKIYFVEEKARSSRRDRHSKFQSRRRRR